MKKPTPAQLRALQYVVDHGENAESESWCAFEKVGWSPSQYRLAGLAHERTFASIRKRGWVLDGELTDAGREALKAGAR